MFFIYFLLLFRELLIIFIKLNIVFIVEAYFLVDFLAIFLILLSIKFSEHNFLLSVYLFQKKLKYLLFFKLFLNNYFLNNYLKLLIIYY